MGRKSKTRTQNSPTKSSKKQKSPTKRFVCKRRGCNEAFKHRTQLVRHKIKCTLKSPQKPVKKWEKTNDGQYRCRKCNTTLRYRMSIHRHVDKCDPTKVNEKKGISVYK